MYCGQCGTEIPDNRKYCTVCGAKVVGEQKTESANKDVNLDPKTIESDRTRRFRRSWRDLTSSTLSIISTIILTLVHGILIWYVFTITDLVLDDLKTADLVNNYLFRSEVIAEIIEKHTFWIGASKFLLVISGVAAIIGVWMIYLDSNYSTAVSISTGGISWLRGAQIVGIVGAGIALLSFNAIVSEIRTLYAGDYSADVLGALEYVSDKLDNTLNTQFTIVGLPYLFALLYCTAMSFALIKISQIASQEKPQSGAFVPIMVVFFIFSVAGVLAGGLWAALLIVAGAFMTKCHQVNNTLALEFEHEKEIERKVKSMVVGMGGQHILQGGWKCSCGRANARYVSSCACGKSKYDI